MFIYRIFIRTIVPISAPMVLIFEVDFESTYLMIGPGICAKLRMTTLFFIIRTTEFSDRVFFIFFDKRKRG